MANDKTLTFDLPQIQDSQQNRYPLLFIDKILEAVPGERATGLKCWTYNEWFFPAHYEDEPNVPGFIQVESLVQTFIMTFLSFEEHKGNKTNFVSMDKVKFKKKIVPGDVMLIEAILDSFKRGIAKGSAKGTVDGELACYAEFVVALPSVFENFKPKG